MDEKSKNFRKWTWFWNLLILLLLGGLIYAIAIPNYIGGGPSKFTHILNNLRQIDAAKNEWTREHEITNANQIAQLAQPLAVKDLLPYQRGIFDSNGVALSVADEIYTINKLGAPPEAILTRKVKFGNGTLPKGTIVRYTTDPSNGFDYEIIPAK